MGALGIRSVSGELGHGDPGLEVLMIEVGVSFESVAATIGADVDIVTSAVDAGFLEEALDFQFGHIWTLVELVDDAGDLSRCVSDEIGAKSVISRRTFCDHGDDGLVEVGLDLRDGRDWRDVGDGVVGEGFGEGGHVAVRMGLNDGGDDAEGVIDGGAIAAEEFGDLPAGGGVVSGDVDEQEAGVGDGLAAGAAEDGGALDAGGLADVAEEANELLADW